MTQLPCLNQDLSVIIHVMKKDEERDDRVTDMLLNKQDVDFIKDNLVFNYCLNREEPVFIKSFIHYNQIDLGFLPKKFFFFMTGTHKKLRPGSTPVSVNTNVSGFHQYCNRIDEVLAKNGFTGRACLIKVDNSKQVGVLFSPNENAGCTPEEVAKIMQQLYYEQFSGHNLVYTSTSLSGPYSGYEQIHQAFLDARVLNDLRFFGIRDVVITREYREKTSRPCDLSAIHANMRKLTTAICTGTCSQALHQADIIIRDMIAPSYSMDNFNAMFMHMQDMLSMLETVYPEYIHAESKTCDDFYTLEDYHLYLRKTICTIFDQLSGISRYNPTVLMALSYINRNYVRDLSLIQLAEYVYANSSTLSSEFNNEVGMSLSEYVTMLRVKKAQELLRTTELTIPQIAQQTGFSSATYFRKIFKKQAGMPPQQYRDNP